MINKSIYGYRAGYGKRVLGSEFKGQRRGKRSYGIKVSPTSAADRISYPRPGSGKVILITARGQVIRHKIKEVSVLGRYSRGVTLMNVEQEDRVVNFSGVE